jgi:hypothetical protein
VVGHVADWEQVGLQGLRDMAAGKTPQVEFIEDIEDWNQVHVGLRRAQSWEEVWEDLHAIHQELLETLGATSQPSLEGSYLFPWGVHGTCYQWLTIFVGHDQEHARDLWSETLG